MTKDKKILIVDDSKIIRDRLIARLENTRGIDTIKYATDLASAFIELVNETPDVAIIDLQLPDGNGMDILTRIKKYHPDTVVIMLTNYPYTIFKKRCFESGADFFFDKSNEFENVFAILKSINEITTV